MQITAQQASALEQARLDQIVAVNAEMIQISTKIAADIQRLAVLQAQLSPLGAHYLKIPNL